jgi:hypothetical protein
LEHKKETRKKENKISIQDSQTNPHSLSSFLSTQLIAAIPGDGARGTVLPWCTRGVRGPCAAPPPSAQPVTHDSTASSSAALSRSPHTSTRFPHADSTPEIAALPAGFVSVGGGEIGGCRYEISCVRFSILARYKQM